HATMIAKRIHGLWRHRVDCVAANQFFDIKHSGETGSLCACTCPENPLNACTARLQLLPARAGKKSLVALVGEFSVSNGDFSTEGGQTAPFIRVIDVPNLVFNDFIDGHVDAAYEEARNTRNWPRITALLSQLLQTCQVRVPYPSVNLLRKQQSDIDIDPLGGEAPDGRQTRLGCRHLHHDVRPVYQLGKAPRFAHRGFGIHCQIWGCLDAGISVSAARLFEDWL